MEATTTSETTFRAVIVHEDGKYGFTYNKVRETADEAFADVDRLSDDEWIQQANHKIDIVVQKTTVTTTTTEVTR